jgi:hypothetical protein
MNSEAAKLAQLLPDFETEQTAFERQSEMIRALKGDDSAAERVAEKLKRCAKGRPCNFSMCPICVRRLRASFVLAACRVIRRVQRRRTLPVTAFCAVPLRDQFLPGTLDQMNVPLINKRVQRQHQRAGFPLVFAGIDLSWNEYSPPKKPPLWQGQVYGVVVGLDVEAVKRAIKHLYPHAASIHKPLRVRKCSNLPKALSYAIKPAFVRRVSHISATNGRQDIDDYWLKRPQLRELALCLGRYKLPVRYALTGCKRYSDRIELNPDVRKRLKELAMARKGGLN